MSRRLLRNRACLSVVDSLDDFYSPAWKKTNLDSVRKAGAFDFFEQDICDADRMREIFARAKPDVVIHLAARAGVRPSIEQPRLYERVNVGGTVNLLELCQEFRVSRLIFGSSSSVYGACANAPFSEAQAGLSRKRRWKRDSRNLSLGIARRIRFSACRDPLIRVSRA